MTKDMTRAKKLATAWATALVLLFGTVAAVHAQITDENVIQKLQSAKTPADHQALAAFFTAKADAASASAAEHEKMMNVSQRGSQSVWKQHCESLIKTFKAQESDYRALAKQQEELAKAGAH